LTSEQDIVIFQYIPIRDEMLEIFQTRIYLVQFVAGVTKKMMVMTFRRHFPPRRLAR
jgi:hypothetical protein